MTIGVIQQSVGPPTGQTSYENGSTPIARIDAGTARRHHTSPTRRASKGRSVHNYARRHERDTNPTRQLGSIGPQPCAPRDTNPPRQLGLRHAADRSTPARFVMLLVPRPILGLEHIMDDLLQSFVVVDVEPATAVCSPVVATRIARRGISDGRAAKFPLPVFEASCAPCLELFPDIVGVTIGRDEDVHVISNGNSRHRASSRESGNGRQSSFRRADADRGRGDRHLRSCALASSSRMGSGSWLPRPC